MTYVGGLRARLVRESVYQAVHASLTALGWFDANRMHLPIDFVSTEVTEHETIPKNTLSLADWSMTEIEEEMGSFLSEHRMTYYLDFYAENDAIGLHMTQDLKDLLGGRMPSIGRSRPDIPVYDFTASGAGASPTVTFYVAIENVVVDRPVATHPWMRYMRTVRFEVVDQYGTEQDV